MCIYIGINKHAEREKERGRRERGKKGGEGEGIREEREGEGQCCWLHCTYVRTYLQGTEADEVLGAGKPKKRKTVKAAARGACTSNTTSCVCVHTLSWLS